MKIKRWALAGVIPAIAGTVLIIGGCTSAASNGGNTLEHQQQQNDTTTFEQNQPIPHFNYSQIRSTLTQIEAMQALGSQTTSFFFNMGEKAPIGSCPSLGQPVPNTASLSNPDQVIQTWTGSGTGGNGNQSNVVGQMDPNGIYTPQSSSGTNVVCLDSQGRPYIYYWEGFVATVSGAAKWNNATGQVQIVGQPTVPTCSVTGKGKTLATTCKK